MTVTRLARPIIAVLTCSLLAVSVCLPSVAAACEGGGEEGGGGSLSPSTSPLNFGERTVGGKYELTEEWTAIGENIATGAVLYEGSAEFTPSGICASKLIVVGTPCKEKVSFSPLAKELYSGKIRIPYETELGHVKSTATVHVEGKGK